MNELTAAHSTIVKALETTNCPQGVELVSSTIDVPIKFSNHRNLTYIACGN